MIRYLHPQIALTRTLTGRLATRGFPVLGLPKRTAVGKEIRKLVRAPKGRVIVRIDYCLAPDTPVLTADLRWVAIGEVRPGETLVGFDENLGLKHNCRYRKAVVEKTTRLKQPCYRIVTSQGTTVASAAHRWAVRKKLAGDGSGRQWVKTEDLITGQHISRMCGVWESDTSRDAGYIAGVFDGEGYVDKNGVIGFSQNPGTVYDEVVFLLAKAGFPLSQGTNNQGGCLTARLLGGDGKGLEFLGRYRPVRLLPKAANLWENKRTWGRVPPAVVLSVEPVGMQEVVGIQTTTGTFIANGMLSHNSQVELRIAAHLSGDAKLRQVFIDGRTDIHTQTTHLVFKEPPEKAKQSEAKRVAGKMVNFGYWMGLEAKGLTENVHKEGNLEWSKDCPGCKSPRASHSVDCDSVLAFAGFDEAYPGARRYQDERTLYALETGFAYGMWGERWYLPGVWSPHDEIAAGTKRQAFALPIQSGNARLIKQAMRRIEQVDLPWAVRQKSQTAPLLQVHDELLFVSEQGFAAEWLARVTHSMEHIVELSVPIRAEGSYGPSWAEQGEA